IDAHAEAGLVFEGFIHVIERRFDLAMLAIDPSWTAILRLTAVVFDIDGDRSVQNTVSDGFPTFHRGTLAPLLGQQSAYGRERIKIFNDDAGIKEGATIIHDETGNLTQRVVLLDSRILRPDIFKDKFVFQLL